MNRKNVLNRLSELENLVEVMLRKPWRADLLVFAIALGLYIKTLSPTIYTFDSAELATGAYTLGIVHNTGYPLYLLLAKLFTLIVPFGDIAYRINLLSALYAALSLVFVRRAALRLSGSFWGSLAATAVLAVSYPLWSMAVVAEVYTMHLLFTSMIVWQGTRWRESGSDRDFILAGLLLGLSFSHHMATVLNLPGLAYLVWATLREGRVRLPHVRVWVLAVAAFLLGPLTYLYLPIRYNTQPALDFARQINFDLSTPAGIFNFLRGGTLDHLFFGYELYEIPGEVWKFLVLVWGTFLAIGLIPAAFGVWELWKRDRVWSNTLWLILAGNAVFYINLRVFDKDYMFLPVFLVISLWIAIGFSAIANLLRTPPARRALAWGTAGFLLLTLALNYPLADLSGNYITRQYAEEVFRQASPDAVIVGSWVDIKPLEYLQIVEVQRPDIILFDYGVYSLHRAAELRASGLSDKATRRIIEDEIRLVISGYLDAGRPVLSTEVTDLLEPAFDLQPVTRWLYAVSPAD